MALVLLRDYARVRHVHMNSPNNLNALSSEMTKCLMSAFDPNKMQNSSVVLLSGAGKHFSAGHDLSEMVSSNFDNNTFRECSRLMQLIRACPVPVVSAVQGCAFAAGCQLAASSDIVLAAQNSKFSTPGVKIGLFCSTPSVAVTRAVTGKTAADMLFTGRHLSAQDAVSAGLASRVIQETDPEKFVQEALKTCQEIAETPREVLVNGKTLLAQQHGKDLGAAYDVASEAMERGLASQCAGEGIRAFLQKRKPDWSAL